MTESKIFVIKGANTEVKTKHSFIKLFYNHTTIFEFLLYIFGMCCAVSAGVCLIQNLGLINDFVALLTEDMTNDTR